MARIWAGINKRMGEMMATDHDYLRLMGADPGVIEIYDAAECDRLMADCRQQYLAGWLGETDTCRELHAAEYYDRDGNDGHVRRAHHSYQITLGDNTGDAVMANESTYGHAQLQVASGPDEDVTVLDLSRDEIDSLIRAAIRIRATMDALP